MKQLIFTFAILLVACGFSRSDEDSVSLADMVEMVEPMTAECEPKPERKHIEELLQLKEDALMETKCLRACLFEQFDMIENGQMIEEKTVEMFAMFYHGADEQLKEIIKICNGEAKTVTEKCENAHSHAMCMKRELKSRGFKIPELE
uniref:Odorant binding protein 2 n=1 Tax=Liriomyza sativae TaxID=127406 RepID=A0A0X8B0S7_LIRSA|nr:odorant binding protein 2 [Liriomyza sativae]